MQSKLTRRAVLAGVPAVALGGTFAAITATAVLADASDARIFALAEEHDRVLAEMNKAGDRWCDAVTEKMPPHLRHVSPFDRASGIPSRELWDAILEACNYPEAEALRVSEDRLKERCHELAGPLPLSARRLLPQPRLRP